MTIRYLEVPGEDAMARLWELREDYPKSGLYPVIVGSAESCDGFRNHLASCSSDQRTTDELIAQAEATTTEAVLQELSAEFDDSLFEGDFNLVSEWAPTPPTAAPLMPLGLIAPEEELLPQVFFALIECGAPWQIPACTRLGMWNGTEGWPLSPTVVQQCAMWRHWQTEWGAEIAAIDISSEDSEPGGSAYVEATTTRVPHGDAECRELEMEHWKLGEVIIHSRNRWLFVWDWE